MQHNHIPNFQADPFFEDGQPIPAGTAIVMAHFGTTHADTRAVTIDAINAKVRRLYPEVELREAYTSRIILKRLRDRGTPKPSLVESLTALADEGYRRVLVMPTVIIDGVEMRSIRRDVDEMRSRFAEVRVGTPLLFHPHDYTALIDAMCSDYQPTTAYVWVGHGTYDASTAQYPMISYVLRQKGRHNVFVGTIEGFPTLDDVTEEVAASGLQQVELVPLMFVAGEHAKVDIAGEWREHFESLGYEVKVRMQGMGEIAAVQDLYTDKLALTIAYRQWDIMHKKKIYIETGEKME